MLWAYFFNCTKERETSEDLVQVTFEKMIRYSANYRGKGTVKSWLFTIARNAMKDEWKVQEKHGGTPIEEARHVLQYHVPAVDVHLIRSEKEALMEQAIKQLAPDKQELLASVKLHAKKYKDLAEQYQMKESALKVKVFRIMQELKAYVEKAQRSSDY